MKCSMEMSNKMKKSLVILLLCVFFYPLVSFEPKPSNFINNYQYALYISWINKGNFKTDTPANFSEQKVEKLFYDKNNKKIKIEYDWKNWKITNQREKLITSNYLSSNYPEAVLYLESLVYRLNAADSIFLFDFMNFTKIKVQYTGLADNEALKRLWKDFKNTRVSLKCTEQPVFDEENDETIFILFSEETEIKIIFPEFIEPLKYLGNKEAAVILPEIYMKKYPTHPKLPEKYIMEKLSLKEYINKNWDKKQSRELLNNKIKNAMIFLQNEFPEHDTYKEDNIYYLTNQPYDRFYCSIYLDVFHNHDGIEISPYENFEIRNKNLVFSDGESIDLSNLSSTEIEKISPFLPHLIYEHRAVGTRLLNFLLIHDDVPTTLVLRTDERELFEIDSYAELLLLLSNYWSDRNIYFSLTEVKKINNYIEFKGILVAEDPGKEKHDMAEIRFHLSKNYNIDLIMMVLHAEISSNIQ